MYSYFYKICEYSHINWDKDNKWPHVRCYNKGACAKIRENIPFSGLCGLRNCKSGLWSKLWLFTACMLYHISSAPCSLPYHLGCWSITTLPFYSLGLNLDKSFLPYYNLSLCLAQSSSPCDDDLPELSPLNMSPMFTLATMHRTRHFGLANWMGQLFSGHIDITSVPESRGKQAT